MRNKLLAIKLLKRQTQAFWKTWQTRCLSHFSMAKRMNHQGVSYWKTRAKRYAELVLKMPQIQASTKESNKWPMMIRKRSTTCDQTKNLAILGTIFL